MITIEERISSKVPGSTSLFVSFPYKKELIDIIKNGDTYNYDKNTKIWEIPITSLSNFLDAACLFDSIKLLPLKKNNRKPKEVEFQTKFKTTPYQHQIDGIKYGLSHDKWLLLDAPGLGKTIQICYIAQELRKRGEIEHCLIICGVNTLKSNWKREIERHTRLSCRILGERQTKTGRTVIGSVKERVEQLNHKISEFFVITNIETIRSDEIVKAINSGKNKFDMIAVDEVHACKSPDRKSVV